jgi:hypothetical protein
MQLESLSIAWDSGCAIPNLDTRDPVAGLQGVLQHMPASSLTQLSCAAEWQGVLPAHFNPALTAADYAAVFKLTGLRSLTLGHRPVGFQPYALGPPTTLQQLTALRLETVCRQQLGLLQLPQLQELCVGLDSGSTAQLQLGHLSSVSRLWVQDSAGQLQLSEQLPPNVVYLWWYNKAAGGAWSLRPLLRLSCLRKLQLRSVIRFGAGAADESVQPTQAAANLAQLSSLSSLQEVGLAYEWRGPVEAVTAAAATAWSAALTAAAATACSAAWQVLPLTSLALSCECMPVSVLQQALPLQALKTLQLVQTKVEQRLAPAALANLLQQTTALQQLQLECYLHCSTLSVPRGSAGGHWQFAAVDGNVDGIARVLRTVCSLPALEAASVKLCMQLSEAAVRQLSHMIQLQLPGMQQYCFATRHSVSLEF